LAAHSGNKNMTDSTSGKTSLLAAHSGKKQDWYHIAGKKNMTDNTSGKKNMIGSTFWEKT
jgi:hypothetical protein